MYAWAGKHLPKRACSLVSVDAGVPLATAGARSTLVLLAAAATAAAVGSSTDESRGWFRLSDDKPTSFFRISPLACQKNHDAAVVLVCFASFLRCCRGSPFRGQRDRDSILLCNFVERLFDYDDSSGAPALPRGRKAVSTTPSYFDRPVLGTRFGVRARLLFSARPAQHSFSAFAALTLLYLLVAVFFPVLSHDHHRVGLPPQGSGENRRGHRGENHGRAAILRRDHPRGPVRGAKVAPSSDGGGGAHNDDREPRVHVLSCHPCSLWRVERGREGGGGLALVLSCRIHAPGCFANAARMFRGLIVFSFEHMRTRPPPSYTDY